MTEFKSTLKFSSDEDKYQFLTVLGHTIDCAETTSRSNLHRRLIAHRDEIRSMSGWEANGTCSPPIVFFIHTADDPFRLLYSEIRTDCVNLYKIMQSVPVGYENEDDDDEGCESCDSLQMRIHELNGKLHRARKRITELEQELLKHGTLPINQRSENDSSGVD